MPPAQGKKTKLPTTIASSPSEAKMELVFSCTCGRRLRLNPCTFSFTMNPPTSEVHAMNWNTVYERLEREGWWRDESNGPWLCGYEKKREEYQMTRNETIVYNFLCTLKEAASKERIEKGCPELSSALVGVILQSLIGEGIIYDASPIGSSEKVFVVTGLED